MNQSAGVQNPKTLANEAGLSHLVEIVNQEVFLKPQKAWSCQATLPIPSLILARFIKDMEQRRKDRYMGRKYAFYRLVAALLHFL